MIETPFIAHSELTNEIYIVVGKEKYRVTEQAIKAVMAIKALEQEPTAKNDLGVDAVSRKQAIEEADKLCLETGYDNEKVIEMLNELPSVTPIRPKGYWKTRPLITFCSECGFELKIDNTNYCPNCGAKMDEPQESEGT